VFTSRASARHNARTVVTAILASTAAAAAQPAPRRQPPNQHRGGSRPTSTTPAGRQALLQHEIDIAVIRPGTPVRGLRISPGATTSS
jgi:hypothetical protein